MDTNPTSQAPQDQTEEQNQPRPKSMRDILIFGVLIAIGVAVVMALITKS